MKKYVIGALFAVLILAGIEYWLSVRSGGASHSGKQSANFVADGNIVKNNPFAGEFENDKDVHVFFLDEELPNEKRELLLSNNNENERYAVQNREIFCHLRVGVLDSLMGKDYIGKKLKVSATARNWRTVNKCLEL